MSQKSTLFPTAKASIVGLINKFEYSYLKGNKRVWLDEGPAYEAVAHFCDVRGYGVFGCPTPLGREVMIEYEKIS